MPPPQMSAVAAGPLLDKENATTAAAAAARRASSVSATSTSATPNGHSGHGFASKLFSAAATNATERPSLGRDMGPTILRLGQPDTIPVLRFGDAHVGGSKTLPLRLENDTPYSQAGNKQQVSPVV
jgi:abnormal spindle-like microcephaly-associated protein